MFPGDKYHYSRRGPLKIFLVNPEFLDHFAADAFVFASHPQVIFKNEVAVNGFHPAVNGILEYLYAHEHIEALAPELFFDSAEHHDQLA